MITIRTAEEQKKMIEAGSKLGAIFDILQPEILPGKTTYELDKLVEKLIRQSGGVPNFALEEGYHNAICASVNATILHGIPSKKVVLKEGDIISIDMGNRDNNGYNGDACRTFAVGNISDEAKRLIRCTEECFFEAYKVLHPGRHLYEISMMIQKVADKYGYSLLKDYTGHGIGTEMHEDPSIFNYYDLSMGKGPFLKAGMCLAIEPMVMAGTSDYYVEKDGWGVVSKDGRLTAHYENDVIITENGPIITTVDSNVRRHLKELGI